eukprot:10802263-Karenia_brevis.AAC.1
MYFHQLHTVQYIGAQNGMPRPLSGPSTTPLPNSRRTVRCWKDRLHDHRLPYALRFIPLKPRGAVGNISSSGDSCIPRPAIPGAVPTGDLAD